MYFELPILCLAELNQATPTLCFSDKNHCDAHAYDDHSSYSERVPLVGRPQVGVHHSITRVTVGNFRMNQTKEEECVDTNAKQRADQFKPYSWKRGKIMSCMFWLCNIVSEWSRSAC